MAMEKQSSGNVVGNYLVTTLVADNGLLSAATRECVAAGMCVVNLQQKGAFTWQLFRYSMQVRRASC
jgi:hypothetical protein